MVWPRRHVSSLLKGLHQAPPARPPCARPAPPPGRRHVVTAEAGAGRVAAAHEAPVGGRGSGVGGGTGRGWGVRGPAHVTDAEVLRRSPPLVARRRLDACPSIFLCISNYTLGRIPANSLLSAAGPPSGCFLIATTVGWLLGPPRFPVPSAPRLHTVSPGPKQPLLLDFCLLTLRKRSCACSECALHAAVAARVEGSTRRRGVGSA